MTAHIEDKWINEAWKLAEKPSRMPRPFHVLTGESVEVARVCQRNWEPVFSKTGQQIQPGLKSATRGGLFTAETPQEILALTEAVQAAQTDYQMRVDSSKAAPVDRAQFMLSEMRATLQWLFDDGKQDDDDARLSKLNEAHDDALSQDAIAAALYDYAELTERHRAEVNGLGGFDVALIDEARALGRALREHSAGPATRTPVPEVQTALELRNRLATLLHHRMLTARAAIRFVFRRHPKIAREAGSTYERRSRARRRQAASEVPASGITGTEDTMEIATPKMSGS